MENENLEANHAEAAKPGARMRRVSHSVGAEASTSEKIAHRDDAVAREMEKIAAQAGGGVAGANGLAAIAAPDGDGETESIELRLPNGAVVTVGPPTVATAFLAARIGAELAGKGEMEDTRTQFLALATIGTWVDALFYVKAVNGSPIKRIVNGDQAQVLANNLGDGGMRLIIAAIGKYWPAPSLENLPVIKKNLR